MAAVGGSGGGGGGGAYSPGLPARQRQHAAQQVVQSEGGRLLGRRGSASKVREGGCWGAGAVSSALVAAILDRSGQQGNEQLGRDQLRSETQVCSRSHAGNGLGAALPPLKRRRPTGGCCDIAVHCATARHDAALAVLTATLLASHLSISSAAAICMMQGDLRCTFVQLAVADEAQATCITAQNKPAEITSEW